MTLPPNHLVKVRNLGRHAEGYWIAEAAIIRVDNATPIVYHSVHRKFGSWMHGFGTGMKDVRAEVGAELQALIKKIERKERRQCAGSEPCSDSSTAEDGGTEQ